MHGDPQDDPSACRSALLANPTWVRPPCSAPKARSAGMGEPRGSGKLAHEDTSTITPHCRSDRQRDLAYIAMQIRSRKSGSYNQQLEAVAGAWTRF